MSEQEAEGVPAQQRRRAHFSIDGLDLRAGPIVIALLVTLAILFLSQLLVEVAEHFIPLPDRPSNPWMRLCYVNGAQLLLTVLAIRVVRRWVPGDFGLRLPTGLGYVPWAILWGLLFGG